MFANLRKRLEALESHVNKRDALRAVREYLRIIPGPGEDTAALEEYAEGRKGTHMMQVHARWLFAGAPEREI